MKIYLAGKYESQARLREVRDKLHAMGHTVVSSWLEETATREEAANTPGYFEQVALRDFAEVRQAHLFALDTLDVSTTGGREVELGIALANQLPIVIVGPQRNVFHSLAQGWVYPDWDTALYFFSPGTTENRSKMADTEAR